MNFTTYIFRVVTRFDKTSSILYYTSIIICKLHSHGAYSA